MNNLEVFDIEFFKAEEQKMIKNNETEIGVKLARLQFNLLENIRAQLIQEISNKDKNNE